MLSTWKSQKESLSDSAFQNQTGDFPFINSSCTMNPETRPGLGSSSPSPSTFTRCHGFHLGHISPALLSPHSALRHPLSAHANTVSAWTRAGAHRPTERPPSTPPVLLRTVDSFRNSKYTQSPPTPPQAQNSWRNIGDILRLKITPCLSEIQM